MDKKKLIIGNMKMYMTSGDVKEYLQNLNLKNMNEQVIFCPSSIYIPYFLGYPFQVGSQNISATTLGAYTGEISAEQLASLGVTYTIVGHSERRMYFDEINEEVPQKMKQALDHHIVPIVCIGETLEEYNAGKTLSILRTQLIDCLTGLSLEEISKTVIAYEPIWAIGTGKIPTNLEIEEIAIEIKKILQEVFQSTNVPVLYGGSVSSKNIEQLEQIASIDGYLIGSASVKTKEIEKILEVVNH